jgi:hypothetical protein
MCMIFPAVGHIAIGEPEPFDGRVIDRLIKRNWVRFAGSAGFGCSSVSAPAFGSRFAEQSMGERRMAT